MQRRGKIIMIPINDICDFSTILYRFIRNGNDMDEIYSLFDNDDPFQYKVLNSTPSEEITDRCSGVLSHKSAIADLVYAKGCEILRFDRVGPGETLLLDPLLAYIRKLEASDVSWSDICKDFGEDVEIAYLHQQNATIERKRELLQINLGSFEATCSAAAGKIGAAAMNKKIKLMISKSALD